METNYFKLKNSEDVMDYSIIKVNGRKRCATFFGHELR